MFELFDVVAMLLKIGVLIIIFFPLPDISFLKLISLFEAAALRATESLTESVINVIKIVSL